MWGKAAGGIPDDKLREAELVEDVRLPSSLCDFIDWVARYTLTPPGAVLAQALRARACVAAS